MPFGEGGPSPKEMGLKPKEIEVKTTQPEQREPAVERELNDIIGYADGVIDSLAESDEWKAQIKQVIKDYIKSVRQESQRKDKHPAERLPSLKNNPFRDRIFTSPAVNRIEEEYKDLSRLDPSQMTQKDRARDLGRFNRIKAQHEQERLPNMSDESTKMRALMDYVEDKVIKAFGK